ncbi:MAG: cation diffusion facilitator family transporter [Methanomassiliicoccales archaeon]|nr:cation diffusion facilitator family transporter [Methanomassiliicoccales archaeon]
MHDDSGPNQRSRTTSKALLLALSITLGFAFVELVGGLISGSLALISDAGHMFTDVVALSLSVWASYVVMRLPNERQTFGFVRVEILIALLNGIVLVATSFIIMYEAVQRIQNPVGIEAPLMLLVAVIGLGANIAGVLILRERAEENLNVKGASLHIFGDMLSSVGVIIGALLIFLFDLRIADPIISILISLVILYSAYKVISQATYVLLEFAPRGVDRTKIAEELRKIAGVLDVEDVHVWTLGSGIYAMSAHVLVSDKPVSACSCIIKECEEMLRSRFNISHSTLQLEYEGCKDEPCPLVRRLEE